MDDGDVCVDLPDSDADLDSVDLNEENAFQSIPVHRKSRLQHPTSTDDADMDDEDATQPPGTDYESSEPGHPSDVDEDEEDDDEHKKQLVVVEKKKGKKVCATCFLLKLSNSSFDLG